MATESGNQSENQGNRHFPRSRAAWAGLALVAVLAAGALALILGSSSGSSGPVTSNEHEIKRQLVTLLHEHALEPHWVACVPSGRRYEGAAVIRCNVNYGDPHIEAICSVLRGGELLTNHEEESIPCQPDTRGWHPYIRTFG